MYNKVQLFIQRKAGEGGDDVITIQDDEEYSSMFKIAYSSPDLRKNSVVYLCQSETMRYINTVLKSFTCDNHPFEYVQVATALHPSVLIHVSDLDDRETRYLIEDMIEMAMRQTVHRVSKS